ncbi:hypothetical protein HDU97_009708 [Phlyctochytrium planicorne]|nr:hypothetical protein HDU97_009708 [Phlyctochytrium planicorne]
MKKGSRDEYLVQKEREPANKDGFGAGTSHPKSWGWATMLPVGKLPEALTADGTFSVFAEVNWYQRQGAMARMMDRLTQVSDLSAQRLLFNETLSDVRFSVYTQTPSETSDYDSSGEFDCDEVDMVDPTDTVSENSPRFEPKELGVTERRATTTMFESSGTRTDVEDAEESDHTDVSYDVPGSSASISGGGIRLERPVGFWQQQNSGAVNQVSKRRKVGSEASSIGDLMDVTNFLKSSATAAFPEPAKPKTTPPKTRVRTKARPEKQYQKTVIPAHRSILASRSDYYFTMFSCGLNESVPVFPPSTSSITAGPVVNEPNSYHTIATSSIAPSASTTTPTATTATTTTSTAHHSDFNFAIPKSHQHHSTTVAASPIPHYQQPTNPEPLSTELSSSSTAPEISSTSSSAFPPSSTFATPNRFSPAVETPVSAHFTNRRKRTASPSSITTETAITPLSPVTTATSMRYPTFPAQNLPRAVDIEIRDFSVQAVRHMLEFIYTGRLAKLPDTREGRFELVKLADRYQIPGLHLYMSGLIFEMDLDLNSAVDILEFADKYSSVGTELKMSCLSYIATNMGRLKHLKEFVDWIRLTEHRDLLVELVQML